MSPEVQIVVITLLALAGLGACVLLAACVRAVDELMGVDDEEDDDGT